MTQCVGGSGIGSGVSKSFGSSLDDEDFDGIGGIGEAARSCKTTRALVAASAGALTLAGSPSICMHSCREI